MSTRSFLKPLSVVLAALTSGTTAASTAPASFPAELEKDSLKSVSSDAGTIPTQATSQRELLVREGGDIFKFVLSRSETGDLVAQHYSHYSHQSHASHASHASHYSSRY